MGVESTGDLDERGRFEAIHDLCRGFKRAFLFLLVLVCSFRALLLLFALFFNLLIKVRYIKAVNEDLSLLVFLGGVLLKWVELLLVVLGVGVVCGFLPDHVPTDGFFGFMRGLFGRGEGDFSRSRWWFAVGLGNLN